MQNVILKAAQVARLAHLGQTRKDGKTPYIYHPAWVAGQAALLLDLIPQPPFFYTLEEIVAAAFLHDVLEDTSITKEKLQEEVGERITNLVVEVTNVYKTGLNRKERKRLEVERLSKVSSAAKVIKMLDRLHNLSDLPNRNAIKNDDFAILYAKESSNLLGAIEDAHAETAHRLSEAIKRILD